MLETLDYTILYVLAVHRPFFISICFKIVLLILVPVPVYTRKPMCEQYCAASRKQHCQQWLFSYENNVITALFKHQYC